MGCSQSSRNDERWGDDPKVSEWTQKFKKIKLEDKDVQNFYRKWSILCESKRCANSSVDVGKFLKYASVSLENTFVKKVLCAFNKNLNFSFGNFLEFTFGLWNFGTLDLTSLATVAYYIYHSRRSSVLTGSNTILLCQDIFGKDFMRTKLSNSVLKRIEENVSTSGFSKSMFHKFIESTQEIFQPILSIQTRIQHNTFGINLWSRYQIVRKGIAEEELFQIFKMINPYILDGGVFTEGMSGGEQNTIASGRWSPPVAARTLDKDTERRNPRGSFGQQDKRGSFAPLEKKGSFAPVEKRGSFVQQEKRDSFVESIAQGPYAEFTNRNLSLAHIQTTDQSVRVVRRLSSANNFDERSDSGAPAVTPTKITKLLSFSPKLSGDFSSLSPVQNSSSFAGPVLTSYNRSQSLQSDSRNNIIRRQSKASEILDENVSEPPSPSPMRPRKLSVTGYNNDSPVATENPPRRRKLSTSGNNNNSNDIQAIPGRRRSLGIPNSDDVRQPQRKSSESDNVGNNDTDPARRRISSLFNNNYNIEQRPQGMIYVTYDPKRARRHLSELKREDEAVYF